MPVNYGSKFWAAASRPLGWTPGTQLFTYVPRLCLPHNRSRCYDWAVDFTDVAFQAPPVPDVKNSTRLIGGYVTSYLHTWSYG